MDDLHIQKRAALLEVIVRKKAVEKRAFIGAAAGLAGKGLYHTGRIVGQGAYHAARGLYHTPGAIYRGARNFGTGLSQGWRGAPAVHMPEAARLAASGHANTAVRGAVGASQAALPQAAQGFMGSTGRYIGSVGRNLANAWQGGFSGFDRSMANAQYLAGNQGFLSKLYGNTVGNPYLNPINWVGRGGGAMWNSGMRGLANLVQGSAAPSSWRGMGADVLRGIGSGGQSLGRGLSGALNTAWSGPSSLITGNSGAANVARTGVMLGETGLAGAGAYLGARRLMRGKPQPGQQPDFLDQTIDPLARGAAGAYSYMTPAGLSNVNVPGRAGVGAAVISGGHTGLENAGRPLTEVLEELNR